MNCVYRDVGGIEIDLDNLDDVCEVFAQLDEFDR